MSVLSNPSIVTNGLIFHYDMNNIQSYRSPPLRNVLTEISPRGQGDSATYKFSNGTESVYIPNLGFIANCPYMDMYNDYNGGSNNCCPSPFGYGQGLSVSGSTEYTYAIVYKSVNGYTNPNYMYHYEYNGGTYITEYGLFYSDGSYSGQVRHLGDDWYWASSKFTTNANCNLFYTGAWMYEYARFNRLYVAKAMIVQGDYRNLHPKFWPALGTTVSNTQTLYDLTGRNTITATSLTYGADGTFSFNGSSNYMDCGNASAISSITGTSNVTVEAWVNLSGYGSTSGYGVITHKGFPWAWLMENPGNTMRIRFSLSSSGDVSCADTATHALNTWYHFVGTYDGSNMRFYRNGQLRNTVAGSGTLGGSGQNMVIGNYSGAYYSQGLIPSVKIYNRTLTPTEIQQNFNAQRGLYGI